MKIEGIPRCATVAVGSAQLRASWGYVRYGPCPSKSFTFSKHHPLLSSPRPLPLHSRPHIASRVVPIASVALRTTTEHKVGIDPNVVLQIFILFIIQFRFFPALWRYVSTKTLNLTRPEELFDFQENVDGCTLISDVRLAGRKLVAGIKFEGVPTNLKSATLPLKIRYPRDWHNRDLAWKQRFCQFVDAASRFGQPTKFWVWGHLLVRGLAPPLQKCLGTWLTRKRMAIIAQASVNLHAFVNITALALLLNAMILWWKSRVSRGISQDTTDVVGWQSSTKEARNNAMKVFMQVVVWTVYFCAVLGGLCGVDPSRALLFPGITAVVLGWVCRETLENVVGFVILNLTQPFAQGDWISSVGLHDQVDGWVLNVGLYHTRLRQQDKRLLYVPNRRMMTTVIRNNSRMTHRRINQEVHLRIRDIPKISKIIQEIQEMINSHEDVDENQHRLVRWRGNGPFSAIIWLSCFTRSSDSSLRGIRLDPYTATQMSIMERISDIVYKNGADFASKTDRWNYEQVSTSPKPDPDPRVSSSVFGGFLQDLGFPIQRSGEKDRESQLESREKALRMKELIMKGEMRELEMQRDAVAREHQKVLDIGARYRDLIADPQVPVDPNAGEGYAWESDAVLGRELSNNTASEAIVRVGGTLSKTESEVPVSEPIEKINGLVSTDMLPEIARENERVSESSELFHASHHTQSIDEESKEASSTVAGSGNVDETKSRDGLENRKTGENPSENVVVDSPSEEASRIPERDMGD